jgi:S1-C subfamily serine protease
LVAVDHGHDLALLRVAPRAEGYPALRLAGGLPEVGSPVFLFGTPLYRHGLLFGGLVARTELGYEYRPQVHDYTAVYYVAGASPNGTSGGPWLNGQGDVVGLQSGVMTADAAPQGVSFVVPLEAIRNLWQGRRSVTTATFGAGVDELWQQDPAFLRRFPPRTEGLVVRFPRAGGPADSAGLKDKDVVIALDDQPVRRIAQFVEAVRARQPGERVKLVLLQPDQGGTRTLEVTLGELTTHSLLFPGQASEPASGHPR